MDIQVTKQVLPRNNFWWQINVELVKKTPNSAAMSGNRTSTHNPTKKILVECVVLYFLWIFRWSLFARRWKKFLCLLFFLVVSNLLIPPPPTTNCYREFLTFFNLRKQFNNIFFPSKKKKFTRLHCIFLLKQ